MAAARRPPSSDPAKVQFFRPTATARSSRSAALFDMQSRPSSRKRLNASQRLRQYLIALVVSLFLGAWRVARATTPPARRSGAATLLAHTQTLLRSKTVDLALDGEQNVDALDRLGRDRRLAEPREVKELAP